MTRLRFVTRLNPSKTEAGELAEYGNITFAPMDALAEGLGGLDTSLERPADELADGSYSYFAEGDLLLAKVTPCFENGKKALVANLPNRIGFATSEVHVIRPDCRKVDPNYLRYLLSSEAFRAAGIASMTGAGGLRRISDNAIKDFLLPVSDLATQKTIATFLDGETARIDRLIKKKERQATLLAEFIASLVTEQTHSENARSALPSKPLKRIVRVNPSVLYEDTDPNYEFDYIDIGSVTLEDGVRQKERVRFGSAPSRARKPVCEGDVIVSTVRTYLKAIARIDQSNNGAVVSTGFAVLRPTSAVDDRYLYRLCQANPFVGEIAARSTGVSYPAINPSALASIKVPLPSLKVQKIIARELEQKIEQIARARALILRSLVLLKERRIALITAAVAGQIDIRENLPAAISSPDREKFRLVVGAEIIHQHRSNPKFGRVKLQKALYLAEAHLGISELQGNYFRQAAGPLDRALIEETERAVEAAGFYRASQADGTGTTVTYTPLSNAGQHNAELKSLLGPRAEALGGLIGLLRDFGTEAIEAITTLYAVWNDALMDGRQPDDSMIVNGVLTEWHEEKGKKFKDSDLRHWLDWMKRNGLTPRGQGPRTTHTMTRDMFA